MAIGERIRWFRKRKNLTQRELGVKIGLNVHNADTRVGQYENEKRNPKPDMIKELADIFGVASEALSVPDIDSYIGLMHTLFALEDRYGLTIMKLDDQVCLRPDINHPNYSFSLADDLNVWYEMKEKRMNGIIRVEEYDQWRYTYPKERVEETKNRLDKQRGQVAK